MKSDSGIHKLATDLAGYFHLSATEFANRFAIEVHNLSRYSRDGGNAIDLASELASTVFIEVAAAEHSVTEGDLIRATWRVSKEWQRQLVKEHKLGTAYLESASTADESTVNSEIVEEVFTCLNELPDGATTLIVKMLEDKSVTTAASEMNVPRATAYRWLSKIRDKMQARMTQ